MLKFFCQKAVWQQRIVILLLLLICLLLSGLYFNSRCYNILPIVPNLTQGLKDVNSCHLCYCIIYYSVDKRGFCMIKNILLSNNVSKGKYLIHFIKNNNLWPLQEISKIRSESLTCSALGNFEFGQLVGNKHSFDAGHMKLPFLV